MSRKRITAILKLAVLFGTPLAVVLGLFGSGVYCGVRNRTSIVRFERNWLGLDVDMPPGPTLPMIELPAQSKLPAVPAKPTAEVPAPAPVQPASPEPAPVPLPVDPPVAASERPAVDPLPSDLTPAFAEAKTLRLEILVDDDIVAVRSDWIDYVQATVTSVSQAYEAMFGIRVELAAIGRAPAGAEPTPADTTPRPGNDMVLLLRARALAPSEVLPERPAPNASFGVVAAAAGQTRPHLRPMLRQLGRMLGALDITDPADPAYQRKSFMSDAPASDEDAPWIDPENRRRILERKRQPAVPATDDVAPMEELGLEREEPAPQEPAAEPPTGDEPPGDDASERPE